MSLACAFVRLRDRTKARRGLGLQESRLPLIVWLLSPLSNKEI
jgi:hypothetical protein